MRNQNAAQLGGDGKHFHVRYTDDGAGSRILEINAGIAPP